MDVCNVLHLTVVSAAESHSYTHESVHARMSVLQVHHVDVSQYMLKGNDVVSPSLLRASSRV